MGDSPQRYVPYTPRQRLPTTTYVLPSASTSNTQHQAGGPEYRPGHRNSWLGHSREARLGTESAEEWVDVWNAITNGKATLLLPLKPATNERITADFVKDHIILCDGPSRKDAPIVTLSGLRGVLNNTMLTFQSSLHPSSKFYQEILAPSTRSTTLGNLPPLPPVTPAFPSFWVPLHTNTFTCFTPHKTSIASPDHLSKRRV
ncbi:hypothetical protein EV421DRAFT_1914100 [Armillaria borealis]|uniref:Uncharacterized protein n=1 Tax=Armillaria borealis TaxID=47425 RepID=A0AA39IVL9_9AGAR|nr:hypothetical protein EV421DRAFT_1914100 [Armillaria borealis]